MKIHIPFLTILLLIPVILWGQNIENKWELENQPNSYLTLKESKFEWNIPSDSIFSKETTPKKVIF